MLVNPLLFLLSSFCEACEVIIKYFFFRYNGKYKSTIIDNEFFYRGGEMADFRSNAIIKESLDVVFAYFANMSYAPEYMYKVEEVEKLTNGPIGVGTKYKETRSVRGKSIVAEIEYLSYKEKESFTRRSVSNGLAIDYHYDFSEIPEGTQVEMKVDVLVKGLMMRLTKGMLVKMIKSEDGFQVQEAKEILEKEDLPVEEEK